MAFFLGLRHGFDLDHLATIDSMTQTVSQNRYLSRMVGFFFSLGHGFVVIGISLFIGSGFKLDTVPNWLDDLGEGISVFFLLFFGLLTFWNAFTKAQDASRPIGMKQYVSRLFLKKNLNGLGVFFIGVLFAFSFDTVSQVVLFSLSAQAKAFGLFCGLMGFVFMLGMMVADGLNGLFVSALIQKIDEVSCLFSRMVGFVIAFLSLGVAAIHSYQWLID